MSSKTSTGVSVGGSSILVIFILLCLTTFATLSMVSARADLRLTERAAEATEAYYAADAAAEEILAEIDAVLQAGKQLGVPANEYLATCQQELAAAVPAATVEQVDPGTLLVRYAVPVDENQQLAVTLKVQDYGPGAQRYIREAWQVISTGEWEPEAEGLDLWTGEEDSLGLAGGLPIF